MHQSPNIVEPVSSLHHATAIERKWLLRLLVAAGLTVVLWQIPGGGYILYPFTVLAVWFHEMAHGLAAMMLGGGFSKLLIHADGSGQAYFTGPLFFGSTGRAIVAAAGPLGPPLAGGVFILASRNPKSASLALILLGVFLLVSSAIWVRSLFGLIAIPLIGVFVIAVAFKGSPEVHAVAIQFLGIQACVSTYRQVGYLFSESAGSLGLSDTANIQEALTLPYWFWGAVIAVLSILIMMVSLRIAYHK